MFTSQPSNSNNILGLHSQSKYATTLRRHTSSIPATTKNNGRLAGKTTVFPTFQSRRAGGTHLRILSVVKYTNKIAAGGANEPEKSKLNLSKKDVRGVITISRKIKEKISEKIGDQWESFMNSIGQGMFIQVISEQIDPITRSGKSVATKIRSWSQPSDQAHYVQYTVNFTVPSDFGTPGAILITNLLDKEIHLVQIVLHGFNDESIFFPANTRIHSQKDNPESRIIFKNQTYLPSQTPPGIKDLRREDLLLLRGNGKGERKPHERIYDYDVYNDLSLPDKSEDLIRPILGGEERPYPRRCRTGRPPSKKDPLLESTVEPGKRIYVPRDEDFEELKQKTISTGRLRGLIHNLIPMIADAMSHSEHPFTSFSDIDRFYNDGVPLKDEENNGFKNPFNPVSKVRRLLKFNIPAVVRGDRFAWMRDSELGRQVLAGVNPVCIELLKEFPILSKLDPLEYGPPESAITRELIERGLNGMSLEEAMEKKRLYIIDYHDMFLPYVGSINSLPGKKTYASRTIFFYTDLGTLQPIVIELSLPPEPSSARHKLVFIPGNDGTTDWLWKLAKAHVCTLDASIHHYVSHWLRVHACTEPYIIATHRHLSSMHPIYKLLHPHMRYTLEVHALGRQSLINAGGMFEISYIADKYGLDLSSDYYKNMWRFDLEGLPADLLRRGMAVEDASQPYGVKLTIEDYPYAADGLLIWSAIKEMVESYIKHYYSDPTSITGDYELQAWWNEIKNKGHHDKRNEPWWPKLKTKEDLSSILTTMIWVASGRHAAVNFSQYPLGSYLFHRPTFLRKAIPKEGDPDYEKFLLEPEHTFLSSFPSHLQATKVMAMLESVSTHSPDEEYLNQLHELHSFANNDKKVLEVVKNFTTKLEEIERVIAQRNKDTRLKNRCGAGVVPYEQLLPSSGPGVTGRGVPNSITV